MLYADYTISIMIVNTFLSFFDIFLLFNMIYLLFKAISPFLHIPHRHENSGTEKGPFRSKTKRSLFIIMILLI